MAERIAILGAGAIGLFYGARLALSGQDVHFLVRSELEAVRSRGITLQSKEGSETLSPVQVHSTAESIGPVDLVFVTLKATANDQLAQLSASAARAADRGGDPAERTRQRGGARPVGGSRADFGGTVFHRLHARGARRGELPAPGVDHAG
jgi:hypothetical protein